jgi:replicative DNA helicase
MHDLFKLPPQVPEVEADVIGSMLTIPECVLIGLQRLTKDDFYVERYALIFEAMKALSDAGNPVNLRAVATYMREKGTLDLIGGTMQLSEDSNVFSNPPTVEMHCGLIIEYSIKRKVIEFASIIIDKGYKNDTDSFELLDFIGAFSVNVLSGIANNASETRFPVFLKALTQRIIDRANNKTQEIQGIQTGLIRLDRWLNGLMPGRLYIIAGRPGMGKTTLLLVILYNIALKGIPVAIISLEMVGNDICLKITSNAVDMEYQVLNYKKFGPLDMDNFGNKLTKITDLPLYVDDPGSMSINAFRTRLRYLIAKYGIKVIGVDYLQLMTAEGVGKQNREREISLISSGLKAASKECNIPIIALSQLSREVEKRGGLKKPNLSDLRESGSIEQDADFIGFMWRPEYYKIQTGDNGQLYTSGYTELDIAKYRFGETGSIHLQATLSLHRMQEVDSPYIQGGTIETPPKEKEIKFGMTTGNNDDLPF